MKKFTKTTQLLKEAEANSELMARQYEAVEQKLEEAEAKSELMTRQYEAMEQELADTRTCLAETHHKAETMRNKYMVALEAREAMAESMGKLQKLAEGDSRSSSESFIQVSRFKIKQRVKVNVHLCPH